MKKTLLLLTALVITALSFGQQKTTLSSTVGTEILLPVGKVLPTTHFAGISANLQFEIKDSSRVSYLLYSGYNYMFCKPRNTSFVQFPALGGMKVHFNDIISLGALGGVCFTNNELRFKFNYIFALGMEYEKLSMDFRFNSITLPGHENDLSTVSLRTAYKL
jgi:hypothetical protein